MRIKHKIMVLLAIPLLLIVGFTIGETARLSGEIKALEHSGTHNAAGAQPGEGEFQPPAEQSMAQASAAVIDQSIADIQLTIFIWYGGVGAFIIAYVIFALLFLRSLMRPINYLLNSAIHMATGERDSFEEMPVSDEIGGLVFVFNSMSESIKEKMEALEREHAAAEAATHRAQSLQAEAQKSQRELKESVDTMLEAISLFAAGNLTVRLPSHSNAEIDKLFSGYNDALASVSSLIDELKGLIFTTNQITTSVNQLSKEVAQDAQVQSHDSVEVASSSEHMAVNITKNAKLAGSASEKTTESGEAARKGIDIVNQTIAKMHSIADSVKQCVEAIERLGGASQEISEVASVIEDIAEQTNLLALNAAIEAARAGDSGKGFAVVATEVRKLSERTMDSTTRIGKIINLVQAETSAAVNVMRDGQQYVDQGLSLADSAHHALQDIGTSIHTMIDLASQLASTTNTEAEESRRMSDLINNIASSTRHATVQINEIDGSLDKLRSIAQDVTRLVSRFEVGKMRALSTEELESISVVPT